MPEKLKIMVVDDEKDNLDLLYRTFRRTFKVLKVDSPAIALEMLTQDSDVVAVVSDQSMPEMSGIQLLSKIKHQYPRIVRILLTGYSDEQLVEAGEDLDSAEVFRCVSKPCQPETLQSVLQEAVEVYQDQM
ncbi:response regulator [Spirulina subsalsa]|uniref:response regulator n=1 Tax=Spirulina subsalsa TaxID=54311 RepID=UPI000302CF15|nr:response regulator [Spirulina subsalsa]